MIVAVTGYVPIPGHPRPEAQYRELGGRLADTGIPLSRWYGTLETCWLHEYLKRRRAPYTHSVADNPSKNSIAYHCVQAQKSELVAREVDESVGGNGNVICWIDYGILGLPGVTGTMIKEFLRRADGERMICIPGCWGRDYTYDDHHPCWRFCGGVWVVPARYAVRLDTGLKAEYRRNLRETGNVSWEVNMLAKLERRQPDLPLRWYKADHDASMFTGYRQSA